jgi:hypothetical protein
MGVGISGIRTNFRDDAKARNGLNFRVCPKENRVKNYSDKGNLPLFFTDLRPGSSINVLEIVLEGIWDSLL